MLLPLELSASGQWPAVRRFCDHRVEQRRLQVASNIARLRPCLLSLLKLVQAQEPRFSCILPSDTSSTSGRLTGLRALSPTQFELTVYLQQLGVFNILEQGVAPGCVALKLADGRKRSMSLWVEFITASGYLSARKIRSRFHSLVAQVLERSSLRSQIELLHVGTEVQVRVHRTLYVRISPAFRCSGPWPNSTNRWQHPECIWPSPVRLIESQSIGFDLLSQEFAYNQNHSQTNNALQPDCWILDFTDVENQLLMDGQRSRGLSMLKTLRERHLDPVSQIITVELLRSVLLFECEKHPLDEDWTEPCLPYRLSGVLLQLISCLQSRSCAHFLINRMDLLANQPAHQLDVAARHCWRLTRELLTDPFSFDRL